MTNESLTPIFDQSTATFRVHDDGMIVEIVVFCSASPPRVMTRARISDYECFPVSVSLELIETCAHIAWAKYHESRQPLSKT